MGTISAAGQPGSSNSTDPLTQLERLTPYLYDDDLDLDAIDGEFYWRCCRRDLHSEVESLVALVRSTGLGRGVRALSERELEQAQAIGNAVEHLVNRFEPEDPHIRRHLFESEGWDWIRLRDGRVTSYPTGPKNPLGSAPRDGMEYRVELRVVSKRWTGADVEDRIVSYITDPELGDSNRRHWQARAESVAVRVAFGFAPAGSEVIDPYLREEPLKLALPHIVVTVAPPLPPAGTIAKLYDDIVLGQQQWHQLAGTPTQQEKRVALRTWATGLLVGSGRKVDHAISDVCAIMNEPEVTSVQFTLDRKRLVARVPEAERYVYAKPPRSLLSRNR